MRFFRCLPVVFSLKSIGHQSFYNSFYFPRAEFWLLENILLRRNSLHSFLYEINYFEFSTRLNMAVSRSALKDSHITHVHSCSVPVNGKGFSCSIENLNKSFWCIRSPKKRICFSSTVTNPRLVLNLNGGYVNRGFKIYMSQTMSFVVCFAKYRTRRRKDDLSLQFEFIHTLSPAFLT